ncbi:hypothetical protein SAMN05421823_101591 [Catalinimonas alkaloidigena]|uniref:Uncharacterized protein n=1 Tax=Catalinimonas alkaloidigena TaxID=1075417 RepID=A0A1G8Y7I3_9BACT|nr:hypothetical protein [Catalinimonas alkaloidigena]SDJ98756.1 hypothetical protein SAMN05421823_101591 [Catalinimonas alkaloidigena]
MERFSNRTEDLINQIKTELTDLACPPDWHTHILYLEIGQLLSHAFSVTLLAHKSEVKFVAKYWNAHYDGSRFQHGIYNLNRLAITEQELSLSETEATFLQSIDTSLLSTAPYKGIVLDGLFCQLSIPSSGTTFTWNLDEEMNQPLRTLVHTLRTKASSFL